MGDCMKERLHKYMARCGVASRRKCEDIVSFGRVKVNGEIVRNIVLVDDEVDIVELDDVVIKAEENKVFIIINKPIDIITSAKDQFNRKTVIDLINVEERIFPVGRLDYDTSGILLLTNDGDVTYKMSHPSHEIDKVYVAEVIGRFTDKEIKEFETGLQIEDYVTSPSRIKILWEEKDVSVVEICIHEGRNRQVRKMCEKIGHPVLRLKRTRFGKLEVGDLKMGEWRYLSQEEIEDLKSM
jgi:23S rRNA pseudouridine2605 synthase